MRDDMFKVIVERPRCINSNAYSRDGRAFRNGENVPTMLGMKRGYTNRKWLNENLAPLKRYLHRQINRPWNKVYSEICAAIDSRTTVQQHILLHLENFVELHARWVPGDEDNKTRKGGHVIVREWGWRGNYAPLDQSSCELYVHPWTGILLHNRHRKSRKSHREEVRANWAETDTEVRRVLSQDVQLHRIDGIWYRLELAMLAPPQHVVSDQGGTQKVRTIYPSCWDAARKVAVSREHAHARTPNGLPGNNTMYGDGNLYARSKRQLNSREMLQYGLTEAVDL